MKNMKNGVPVNSEPVAHRSDEYDPAGFDMLLRMQEKHFWYRGRRRFLLHAVRRWAGAGKAGAGPVRAVDLGGGCGGWVAYFHRRSPVTLAELALADSSSRALELAAPLLPPDVSRYQVDLLRLPWESRWDMIFLLDVLEHIPQDRQALAEVHRALAPGGLVFITVPALQCFWTWNDVVAHHQRRYSRIDLRRLADQCGFEVLDARYFMFFLSPLLWLSRAWTGRKARALSEAETRRLAERMHRVPIWPVNAILTAVFFAETPLGHLVRFPWRTSVLGIFRRPRCESL